MEHLGADGKEGAGLEDLLEHGGTIAFHQPAAEKPYNTLCALASAFTNQLAHYKTQFRNVVYLRLFVAFPGPELHCWDSDNSICLDDLLFEFLLMVVQQQVRLVRCNSREGCLTPFQRIELALKYFPRGGRELEE